MSEEDNAVQLTDSMGGCVFALTFMVLSLLVLACVAGSWVN